MVSGEWIKPLTTHYSLLTHFGVLCLFPEYSPIKWQRQQVGQAIDAFHFLEVGEDDFEIAAELPENLPARTAWRRRVFRVRDDRDAREFPFAFGNRFDESDALGTDRQAVGRILDVAAGEDRAARRFQRGADLKAGI